jgi:hypothetical protein
LDKESVQIVETIFVSVASLDDKELPKTIINAIQSASIPERVILGVSVVASDKKLLSVVKKIKSDYPNNIRLMYTKIKKSNEKNLIGVGRGRLKAASMYSQEDYFLQIDSHSMFTQGWDSDLISLLRDAKTEIGSEKVILTAYAGKYYIDGNGNRFTSKEDNIPGDINKLGFLYPTFVDRGVRNDIIPAWAVSKSRNARELPDKFVPSFKFNANFAFGDRDFANNLSITEREIFFEEELLQTIRLMRLGFSLVFPNVKDAQVKHLYADHGDNEEINRVYKRRNIVMAFLNVDMGNQQRLATKNYFDFISNPENKEVLESYQRYSGVNLFTAKSIKDDSFPDRWKLDIFGDWPYNIPKGA